MSIKVMSWVWDHSASTGVDRLVLLAIADAASDDGGQAWPSRTRLAHKAGIDDKTVRRAIIRLAKMGELTVRTNAGPGGANCYRVTMKGGSDAPGGTAPPPGQNAPRAERPPGAESPSVGGGAPPNPSLNRPTEELRSSESENPGKPRRADVEQICRHLADRIEANGSNRPPITAKWRTAARLLLDRDKRTVQLVINAINWSQGDEFWRANILSMPTLREKYDQLRLAAARTTQSNGRPPTPPTPVPPPARQALADLDAKVAEEQRRHPPPGRAWVADVADVIGRVPA